MTTISPFLVNFPDLESATKRKHLLFDADAIISVIEYSREIYIILQNNKSSKILYLLQINRNELKKNIL
jgi:hypothetical protein